MASEEQERPLGTSGYISEGKLGWRVPCWVGCAGSRKDDSDLQMPLVLCSPATTGRNSKAVVQGKAMSSKLPWSWKEGDTRGKNQMQRNKGHGLQSQLPCHHRSAVQHGLSSLPVISWAGHLALCPLQCRSPLSQLATYCSRAAHTPYTSDKQDWLFSSLMELEPPWALQLLCGSIFIAVATSQCPPDCLGLESTLGSYAPLTPLAETTPTPSRCIRPKSDSPVYNSRSVSHCPHPEHLRCTAEVISLHMESESREDEGDKGDRRRTLFLLIISVYSSFLSEDQRCHLFRSLCGGIRIHTKKHPRFIFSVVMRVLRKISFPGGDGSPLEWPVMAEGRTHYTRPAIIPRCGASQARDS